MSRTKLKLLRRRQSCATSKNWRQRRLAVRSHPSWHRRIARHPAHCCCAIGRSMLRGDLQARAACSVIDPEAAVEGHIVPMAISELCLSHDAISHEPRLLEGSLLGHV